MDIMASNPVPYNLVLTDANTEYSQALPANTKMVHFQARTNVDVRFAFVTGKVGGSTSPFATLKAGQSYSLDMGAYGNLTLFLASSVAGTVVEIICYV
jgi:hypothetical protein